MSLNICSVKAFFPPKIIMYMESVGPSVSVVSAGRNISLKLSFILAVAGSYKSAECPYLATGLKPEFNSTHSPT